MIRIDETMHYEFDDVVDMFELMTFEDYVKTLSVDELMDVLDEIVDVIGLETEEGSYKWDICYNEYRRKEREEHLKYFEENFEEFTKFENDFREKCENGTATMDELSFYSDWHKDMYGHRPRYDWIKVR